MILRLTIELGNELMQNGYHVMQTIRESIRRNAGMEHTLRPNHSGKLLDGNGNSVGTWEVTDADEQEYKSPDWVLRLQDNYDNVYEQWESFDRCYNLATRLGFRSAQDAWDKNPWIGGSTNPREFRVICK